MHQFKRLKNAGKLESWLKFQPKMTSFAVIACKIDETN